MMKVIVEVCRSFTLTVSAKKTETHVYAFTAFTGDDGASRRGRANLQTGAILPLPGGRRDRNTGHIR